MGRLVKPEPKNGVAVPILGRVAAGIPIDAIQEVEGWEELPRAMAAKGEYFALRVKGDSMSPTITNGSVVIVRKQNTVENRVGRIFSALSHHRTCRSAYGGSVFSRIALNASTFCGFKASRISHRIRFSYFAYQSPVEHLLYTALNRSALRLMPTMASADFSQFVVTMTFASPVRPRGISRQSFLVYLPDLRTWVTIAFGTSLPYASLSAMYALYQVSVRQATILLSLLLACTSRCKPWESLWGSSATTPLVDFHHRLTACPSYKNCGLSFLTDRSGSNAQSIIFII